MDVGGWLRGLGLGRYEEKFRENKIDFDVLADLTDGDLQELGVLLGDRRRLLRAIAELGAQQPLTTQARPTPAAPARRGPSRSWIPPNDGRSPSCSAILSARPALQPVSTSKTGAICSAPISTRRQGR